MRVVNGLPVVLAVLAGAARVAYADEPKVVTLDGAQDWPALVDAIEGDPTTQGREYELRVEVEGQSAECGTYTLVLDDVGARAFRLGACDPANNATSLEVVSRAALFEPGDPVPRARAASIHATIIQRHDSDAKGGGGGPKAGATVWCTVALEPYLWDALAGRPVELTPDRYAVTALDGDIDVVAAGDGWVARGPSSASLSFKYEVSDLRTKVAVVTGEATLACAQQPTGATSQAPPLPIERAAPPEVPEHDRSELVLSDAAVLTRPLDGLMLADGRAASSLGGHRGVYYGTALGYSVRDGAAYVAARSALAWGDHAGAYAFSFGVGLATGLGDGEPVTLYTAPSVRMTMIDFEGTGATDTTIDLALLGGLRWRWAGGSRDVTIEATAPIGGSGVWQLVAGVSFVSRTRLP
jgi:hypothetical protein